MLKQNKNLDQNSNNFKSRDSSFNNTSLHSTNPQPSQKDNNYTEILKKAFFITKTYKFLWILGFFTALISGGGGSTNVGLPPIDNETFDKIFEEENPPSDNNTSTNIFLNEEENDEINDHQSSTLNGGTEEKPNNTQYSKKKSDKETAKRKIKEFIREELVFFLIIILLSLAITITLIYLGISGQAGLMLAIDKINSNIATNFYLSFKEGRKKFWILFFFKLMKGIFIFGLFIILAIPLAVFLAMKNVVLFIIFGIIAILFFIAILVLTGTIGFIAEFFIIIFNQKIITSLNLAYDLLRKKLGKVILGWLIIVGISIGAGIVMIILVIPLLIGFIAVGFGIYFAFKKTMFIFGILIALLFCIFLIINLILKGILIVFHYSYWIILLKEITDSTVKSGEMQQKKEWQILLTNIEQQQATSYSHFKK